MATGRERDLIAKTMKVGSFAIVAVVGVANCSNEGSPEITSIAAPLGVAMTDDNFRAAAGCPDCKLTARSTVTLPLTGKVFTQVKMEAPSTKGGGIHPVALDGRGNVVDPRDLLAAEGKAKMARQGKLRDDVYALSRASSSELVPVSIWADVGIGHAPREQVLSNSTLRARYQAQTSERLHAATSKVTAWIDARGFRTQDRGIANPVVTADVPPSALEELGRLDGVAFVEFRGQDVPAGTSWFDAVKGPAAQMVIGSVGGLPFCNGEGGQPDDFTYLSPYTIFDPTAPVSQHTRWTSELISATAGIRMAPGAAPFIAGWNDSTGSKYGAWDWCYSNGIHNLNRSAGSYPTSIFGGPMIIGAPSAPRAEDMAQDFYAYQPPFPLITVAAGNCTFTTSDPTQLWPCYDRPDLTSVGNRSYNTLNVGASDSNNSGATNNDTMASFSQYTNPITTNSDFELPNLVAPGDDTGTADHLKSASVSGYSGTSGSAPIALGTVLLMKTKDGGFNSWPEMMRATILTASTHPVDGARTERLGGGEDRKQGAGLLNTAVAVNLADPSYRVFGPNNPGTSQGRVGRCYDFATDFSSNLSAPYNIVTWSNGRLRVVAAWDATTRECASDGSGCTGVTLDADLDLRVSQWTGASWQQVCSSASYDSSWELCDIAVNAGEVYKAELVKWSASAAGTCAGIAWNNYDPNAE